MRQWIDAQRLDGRLDKAPHHAFQLGQRLGQVRDHYSHARFYVHGSTLVHEARPYGRNLGGDWVEEPRRLRGVALASGSQVWSRPLRDPTFVGQYPP